MSHNQYAIKYFSQVSQLADTQLNWISNQQDTLLQQKTDLSMLDQQLNRFKGGQMSQTDMDNLTALGKSMGVDLDFSGFVRDGNGKNGADGKPLVFMCNPGNYPNVDGVNDKAFQAMIKGVEDKLSMVSDKMQAGNTKVQMYLSEDNGAQSLETQMMSDYKALWQSEKVQ
jgi:hypothetical protein